MGKMRQATRQVPARSGQRLRATWLLVCMLPYLLFALLGEGLHTHHSSFTGSEHVKATATAVATHADQVAFASAVIDHHVDSETECLACQWSANSTAVLPLLQPQFSPSVEVVHVPESVTVRWTSRATASALGRGPPTV